MEGQRSEKLSERSTKESLASSRQSTKSNSSGGVGLTISAGSVTDVLYWELVSIPEGEIVENDMLLSTSLGTFLDRHQCLDMCLWLLVVLQCLLVILATRDPTSPQKNLLDIPSSTATFMHCVTASGLAYLLAHRCNRRVLRVTSSYCDFWMVFLPYVGISIVWAIYDWRQSSVADRVSAAAEHAILLLFRLPALLFLSSIDSLFKTRRARMVISCLLCYAAVHTWIIGRCVSRAWGTEPNCNVFDNGGIAFRELYLYFHSQQMFFMFTGLVTVAQGNFFCYLCPCFIRSEKIVDKTHYVSHPGTLRVRRKMLLRTPIGDYLERNGYMDMALMISVALMLSVTTIVGYTASYKKNDEGSIDRTLGSSRDLMLFWRILHYLVCLFLAFHRYNLDLFKLCFRHFDVVLVAMCGVGGSATSDFFEVKTFGSKELIWILMDLSCACCLMALQAGIDALRASRKVRALVYFMAIVYAGITYVENRCFTVRWGLESDCDTFLSGGRVGSGSISAHEIYMSLSLLLVLTYSRRVCAHLAGGHLAVWCPCYIPLSTITQSGQPQSPDSGDHEQIQDVPKVDYGAYQTLDSRVVDSILVVDGVGVLGSESLDFVDMEVSLEAGVEQPNASLKCPSWIEQTRSLSSDGYAWKPCRFSL